MEKRGPVASAPAETRSRLEVWLARQIPAASGLTLSPLTKPSLGFSNDTMLCHITYKIEGRELREDLVVRLEPADFRVFPQYDPGVRDCGDLS